MNQRVIFSSALLAAVAVLVPATARAALPVPPSALVAANPDADMLVTVAARGGAKAKGGGKARSANVKSSNVNRKTNVNRGKSTNVNRNVNVNRDVNVNVVRRPVRAWAPRPYYGTIVGGVALGTVIAATAVGVAPAAPASNMCWFWSDSAMTRGYWDYCTPPL